METTLNDKLRVVAEYDGWEDNKDGTLTNPKSRDKYSSGIPFPVEILRPYTDDWSWLIPVWSKLCNHKEHRYHITAREDYDFNHSMKHNRPDLSFEILYTIITRINQPQ